MLPSINVFCLFSYAVILRRSGVLVRRLLLQIVAVTLLVGVGFLLRPRIGNFVVLLHAETVLLCFKLYLCILVLGCGFEGFVVVICFHLVVYHCFS